MENRPLVSIIITCSNQGLFIEEAIQSVLNQRYLNKEIIVVDDGSRDNSREKIQRYSQISKYFTPNPHSSAFARNIGLRQAKGEYTLCLDGDDFLEPNFLEMTVPIMNRNTQISVVYTDSFQLESGRLSYRGFQPFCRDTFLRGNYIPSASLFRKKTAFEVGLQDETLRILEDYDFWLKMTRFAYAYYLPKPLYTYRLHRNNKSRKDSHAFRLQFTKEISAKYRKHEPVLIRLQGHPEVFEITKGKRCHITSRKAFEERLYAWHKVVSVDPTLINLYSLGKPII